MKKNQMFNRGVALIALASSFVALGIATLPVSAYASTNAKTTTKRVVKNKKYVKSYRTIRRYSPTQRRYVTIRVPQVVYRPTPVSDKPTQSKPVPTTPAPAPVPVPTQPAPTAEPTSGYSASEIINLVNKERAANGLAPVSANGLLNQAAYNKSKHMSDLNYFSHNGPDGTNDFTFVDRTGYRYSSAGSNIAKGNFGGSAGLVKAWMDSPGHRANILAPYATEMGAGIYGQYYTMMVAKPL